MISFHQYRYTQWVENAFESFGYLVGHPLLYLQSPGIHLDQPGNFRKPKTGHYRAAGKLSKRENAAARMMDHGFGVANDPEGGTPSFARHGLELHGAR